MMLNPKLNFQTQTQSKQMALKINTKISTLMFAQSWNSSVVNNNKLNNAKYK